MATNKMIVLRNIAKAIKNLDEVSFIKNENTVDSKENVNRIDDARRNLINVIFDNGYELSEYSYKVVKSKYKRNLI